MTYLMRIQTIMRIIDRNAKNRVIVMPIFRQYKVVILGFNGALSSVIAGALDVFSFTGVSWQRIHQEKPMPRFEVSVASMYKQPIECSNKLIVLPHEDIRDVENADILLIPTIAGPIEQVLAANKAVYPIIKRLAQQNVDIASNCSGAFLLAEAGLLDGKTATTHWGYEELFMSRYPQVELNVRQLITQSDNVFCAGGGVAFNDLCLMLIERYCGHEVANQVAKAHVINRQSDFQATYSSLLSFKEHNQQHVIRVQEYIESYFNEPISIATLATIAQCTERTLNRHFKRYVGVSPVKYIQSVRIENAKRLLEQDTVHIKKLPEAVGYDDYASFGRLFKSNTGLTPAKYREKFRRNFIM